MFLMFILILSETIDLLAMANNVLWCDHVLMREYGHILRMALILRMKVKGRKGGQREH